MFWAESSPDTTSQKRGQALLEYLLLIVVLASVSFAFSSFVIDSVFSPGLSRLPVKMSSCLSTVGGSSGACN